jgi:hypothetical protein
VATAFFACGSKEASSFSGDVAALPQHHPNLDGFATSRPQCRFRLRQQGRTPHFALVLAAKLPTPKQ